MKALKETYATCCQTTARIDVIINKIKQNTNKQTNTDENENENETVLIKEINP